VSDGLPCPDFMDFAAKQRSAAAAFMSSEDLEEERTIKPTIPRVDRRRASVSGTDQFVFTAALLRVHKQHFCAI